MNICRRVRENATTALADKRQVQVVVNTDEVGLDDLIVVSAGCERNVARALPVLFGHNPDKAIAKVVSLDISQGSVRALLQFPKAGITTLSF